MRFVANDNLGRTNKRIVQNLNTKLFVGGGILLTISFIVISRARGIFFYIDLGIAFGSSCLLYIPPSVNIIRKLRRIVSCIEIDGDMVRVKENDIRSFLGFVNFAREEISFALGTNGHFEMENDFRIVDYKTEVCSFYYDGKKYYLVEAFFDDFYSMKTRLYIDK